MGDGNTKNTLPRYWIAELKKSIQDNKESKIFVTTSVSKVMGNHFEAENDTTSIFVRLVNANSWLIANDNIETFSDSIKQIFNYFMVPLKKTGLDNRKNDVLDQWHSIIDYTVTYLNMGVLDYRTCRCLWI